MPLRQLFLRFRLCSLLGIKSYKLEKKNPRGTLAGFDIEILHVLLHCNGDHIFGSDLLDSSRTNSPAESTSVSVPTPFKAKDRLVAIMKLGFLPGPHKCCTGEVYIQTSPIGIDEPGFLPVVPQHVYVQGIESLGHLFDFLSQIPNARGPSLVLVWERRQLHLAWLPAPSAESLVRLYLPLLPAIWVFWGRVQVDKMRRNAVRTMTHCLFAVPDQIGNVH